jgi:hypothetical protein
LVNGRFRKMDPEILFKPHILIFKLHGIKLEDDGTWKDRLLKYFGFALLINSWIIFLGGVNFILLPGKTLDEIVEAISTTSVFWEISFQVTLVSTLRNEILKLMTTLKDFTFTRNAVDEFTSLKREIRKSRKTFGYILKLMLLIVVNSFLKSAYDIFFAGKKVLLVKAELSLGSNYSVPYEVMYALQIFGAYSATLMIVAFDMLIYEFGCMFLRNLDMLHCNIRQAIKDRNIKSLEEAIQNQNELTELFLDFKSIFASAIFSRILLSSFTICVIGFHMIFVRFVTFENSWCNLSNFEIQVEDAIRKFLHLGLLMIIWVKLFMYSNMGTKILLKVASQNLSISYFGVVLWSNQSP